MPSEPRDPSYIESRSLVPDEVGHLVFEFGHVVELDYEGECGATDEERGRIHGPLDAVADKSSYRRLGRRCGDVLEHVQGGEVILLPLKDRRGTIE